MDVLEVELGHPDDDLEVRRLLEPGAAAHRAAPVVEGQVAGTRGQRLRAIDVREEVVLLQSY